jgi:hypothetical protein
MEGRNRWGDRSSVEAEVDGWGDRSSVEAEVDGEAAVYGEVGVERKL